MMGLRLALALLVSSAAGIAHAQMTPARISAGFLEGVTQVCVPAVALAGGVGALPAAAKARVSPASEDARFLAQARNPSGPLWNVESAKGVVIVSEPGPGQCEVIAYGPPVASTFQSTVRALERLEPGFEEAAGQRRGSPFLRHALSGTGSAQGLSVVLDGSEPGAPGRMFRFSLLSGYVTLNQTNAQ